MSPVSAALKTVSAAELQHMHDVYREGGEQHQMAPHIIYSEEACPYPSCGFRMQAIDFRLEAYGPGVHDPLVRAWWADVGFAGRCPKCDGWIHFTIRGKRAISSAEASTLPN